MKKLILFVILLIPACLFSQNTVEITGKAYDRKGGAVVATDSIHYWIQDKDFWEDEYLNKTVTVKGELQVRNDNPVVLDTGVVKSQGIPVYTEEELKKQQQRYWLINATVRLN